MGSFDGLKVDLGDLPFLSGRRALLGRLLLFLLELSHATATVHLTAKDGL